MIHLTQDEIKNAHDLILFHTLIVLKESQGYLTENDHHRNTPGELFPGRMDAIIDNMLFPKDDNYLVCHRVSKFMFDVCTLHPYIEGNKRTAYFVSSILLAVNGLEFRVAPTKAERFLKQIAAGRRTQSEVEVWIKKNCRIMFVRAIPLFLVQGVSIIFAKERDIPLGKLGLKDNFTTDLARQFVRSIVIKRKRKMHSGF